MKGDHRFQDMGTPLNLYPVGQKCAQTGGLPNSEVVSEVRGLWLRTTPLTCDVCVDSGWWASELNCGTADKNYKRWVLKTDWRETRADTGRRVRRPLQLSDGGFRPAWMWWRYRGMILFITTVDATVFAWRAGVEISRWLYGAWCYYWGLSCLICCCWHSGCVSSPPLHCKACCNKAAHRETRRWGEILPTDSCFSSSPHKQCCNKDAYTQLLDCVWASLATLFTDNKLNKT